MYQFGDIVLLEYPYTDLSGVKLRPAIVLKDTNDFDFITARVTSQSRQTEYDIEVTDWKKARSLLPSIIRKHKIATLETKLVKRQMGKLSASDLDSLLQRITSLFDIQ